MAWEDDQEFEKNWWNGAINTWWEENKQQVYLKKMGIPTQSIDGKFPVIDAHNQTILDVGGGPISPLLKCINLKKGYVIDPCDYPQWTTDRYSYVNIEMIKSPAEVDVYPDVDEIWMMNCLQHVQDVEKIANNMLKHGKVIRIFEWIDEPVSPGHPQLLTEERLNRIFKGIGKTEQINEQGAVGRCWYGVFPGERYV